MSEITTYRVVEERLPLTWNECVNEWNGISSAYKSKGLTRLWAFKPKYCRCRSQNLDQDGYTWTNKIQVVGVGMDRYLSTTVTCKACGYLWSARPGSIPEEVLEQMSQRIEVLITRVVDASTLEPVYRLVQDDLGRVRYTKSEPTGLIDRVRYHFKGKAIEPYLGLVPQPNGPW